jgi:hypothetical protein
MSDKKFTEMADLLEEDKPIAGQKFVCVSFVSPEKILKQKEMFFFEEFVKHFELEKSMTKFTQFLDFMCYKHNLKLDAVMQDFKEFSASEKENLIQTTIEDDYKNFLDAREEELQQEFNIKHNFQTNVRGLKVRGSFPTQEEAELRCRMLRERDPNHDIYVGPVGVWMPYDPVAYRDGRVEYLEKELNELMSEKQKNEQKAKQEFDERVAESKRKAIEENKKKAAETGASITQDYVDGELVAMKNTNTTENTILESTNGENVTVEDVRKELFEGEGIITKDMKKSTTSTDVSGQ